MNILITQHHFCAPGLMSLTLPLKLAFSFLRKLRFIKLCCNFHVVTLLEGVCHMAMESYLCKFLGI